jgi:Domain of unknown function (DUF4189)
MRLILIALAAAALLLAPVVNASPEDPHGDDYAAVALSPSVGIGGYGSDGTADGAARIALSECARGSGAGDCVVTSAIHHGCVLYVISEDGQQWAGGRGPDPAAALADAQSKLPVSVRAVDAHCST